MHDQRHRYEAEVGPMESTTALGDFLDVDRLRETMRGRPWGDPRGGMGLDITALNRILALGFFIRSTEQRLRNLAPGRLHL